MTLAATMAVGPLALFALSALSPFVTADLGLRPSQFGALATLSFATATPSAWLLGRWVDRCSARAILLGVFSLAGLALVVTASARSFGWLVVGVLITGVAMAVTNPVTNRLVSVEVADGQRGGVMGVKQSGVQLGQLLLGLTLPSLAAVVGWRGAVAATLSLVVVGLALTRRYVSAVPGRTAAAVPRKATEPLPYDVWVLLLYGLVAGGALQATNVYLPLFAFEQVAFSAATAGLTAAVVGGVGLIARVAWGRSTERSTDPRRLLVGMAIGGTSAAGLLAAASWAHEGWLVWAAAALTGATAVAANVVVMTAAVRAVGSASIGNASGLLALGLYAGFALGPLSFGLIVEATSYTLAWLVAAAVYACAALLVAAAPWAARWAAARGSERTARSPDP